MSVEVLIARVRANGGVISAGVCAAIKSLPACINVMEKSKEEFYKTECAQGKKYNEQRRRLSKVLLPEPMWCLAGLICERLYATVELMSLPNPDRAHIFERDSLVAALTVLIGLIYLAAYDIAPLKSWGHVSIVKLLPLSPDDMAQVKLKNYDRLILFREFFYNGVSPLVAVDLVRNWYLLQPRNRALLLTKKTKVDRELAITAKMAEKGIGKFWTAWRDDPYLMWDVHHEAYVQSNQQENIVNYK